MKPLITWFLNQAGDAPGGSPAGGSRCPGGASERLQGPNPQDPQFREFPFEMQVFGRYARVEKALVNAIVEFWSGLFEDLKERGLTGVQPVHLGWGIPASRRRLKPPSSVHPGRCVRFIVPGRS